MEAYLDRQLFLLNGYPLARWWERKAVRIHLSSICYVFGGVDFQDLMVVVG